MTTLARLCTGAAVLLLLAAPAEAAAPPLTVSVDRTTFRGTLGHTFAFRTTITNHGEAPATGLIAHLNILSLDGGVYVDPEDWSSHRTRYLPPIPPRRAVTLTWRLKAVSAGSLGVYVAVLPRSGRGIPLTGETVHVTIADRRTLNSGGVIPLVIGMPALLALLALSVGVSRARRRH